MYRIELRERDHSGPEIHSDTSVARYASIRQATMAAKEAAFAQTAERNAPIAVRILSGTEKVMIRLVVPAWPIEAQRALFPTAPTIWH